MVCMFCILQRHSQQSHWLQLAPHDLHICTRRQFVTEYIVPNMLTKAFLPRVSLLRKVFRLTRSQGHFCTHKSVFTPRELVTQSISLNTLTKVFLPRVSLLRKVSSLTRSQGVAIPLPNPAIPLPAPFPQNLTVVYGIYCAVGPREARLDPGR